jgi:hypothetical protein
MEIRRAAEPRQAGCAPTKQKEPYGSLVVGFIGLESNLGSLPIFKGHHISHLFYCPAAKVITLFYHSIDNSDFLFSHF